MKLFKKDYYHNEVPWLLRKLGCFELDKFGYMRFSWGELSLAFGFALQYVTGYGDHKYPYLNIHIIFGNLWIKLPWKHIATNPDDNWGRTIGVSVTDDALHLHSFKDSKTYWLPWSWSRVKYLVMCKDGVMRSENTVADEDIWYGVYDYTYVLESGKVQKRKATISTYVSEWRWLWFKWFPFFSHVRSYIEVTFSQEVGEGIGSWKGGVVCTSFNLKKDEAPWEALRRMEKERKF